LPRPLLPALPRPGVAVRHTPLGVAKRPCRRVPNDTEAYTPTAEAPPCAERRVMRPMQRKPRTAST